MRLPPTPTTIKRLFSLSGNRCALPGCTTSALVLNDGTIVAEICHIEGAEPGGERFNENMTDEQRRAFENLMLLCAVCHKRSDNVDLYPVETLVEIKQSHEAKMAAGVAYQPSERAVQKVIEQFNLTQNITAARDVAVTQTGSITIMGASTTEIVGVFQELWTMMRPVLLAEANTKATEQISDLEQRILREAENRHLDADGIRRSTEPAVQMMFQSAAASAVKRDSPELREQLGRLVVDRLQTPDERMGMAIEQAVVLIGALTQRQIHAIATSFAIKNFRLIGLPNWISVERLYIKKILLRCYDPDIDAKDVRYAAAAGAGTISLGSLSVENALSQHYRHVFLPSFPATLLQEVASNAAREVLVRSCVLEGPQLELKLKSTQEEISVAMESANVPAGDRERILGLYNQGQDVSAELRKHFPQMLDLSKHLSEIQLDNLDLSPAAFAIALSYIESKTGMKNDWSIWL